MLQRCVSKENNQKQIVEIYVGRSLNLCVKRKQAKVEHRIIREEDSQIDLLFVTGTLPICIYVLNINIIHICAIRTRQFVITKV